MPLVNDLPGGLFLVNLEVIRGGKAKAASGNFVCPWCALRCETRKDLNAHWLKSRVCARHKSVNNQTQSKYNDAIESTDADD